jgi:hypothetical protein
MLFKGIGSKLMAKMGYVVGTGLGKSGEGIMAPVEAVILPAGKSLGNFIFINTNFVSTRCCNIYFVLIISDHCMNLKEAAGGSKDLFSAERIQKKLALREIRRSQRKYAKDKEMEKHDVFNVINNLSASEYLIDSCNTCIIISIRRILA